MPVSSGAMAGVWSVLGEVRTTAELQHLGFAWVGIDAQHGHHDDRSIREALALRRERRTTVVVRVAANEPMLIGRALDAGADGVIVPLVQDAKDAARAVEAAHYPPRGVRSWGPLARPGEQSGLENQPRPHCAVMIETASALHQADEIARIPDLDQLFVGPFDLSIALGREVDDLLGDFSEDAPLPTVVRACRAVGITAGAFAGSADRAKVLRRHGFTWVAVTTDAALLRLGAAASVADW